ncbi:MAG: 2-amino-4-hydroxy-6-hydroxymethyldihydropteridine diphosphokinase [Tannerella sp.]|jgi:2-amino-4-hydroxy-6-hydroxymethyldihydropteridine diphosphokinase|nr:2-amino-4-hydroxy-6-hydroxymethyldihydropteridine diphosphokinase [Tannerella sp.]
MAITYLSLGANLGNRRQQLRAAASLLDKRAGHLLALSRFYETVPWGYDSPHSFLNVVVQLETALPPQELLSSILQIERDLGRTAKTCGTAYQDRLIDIDILLYDQFILEQPNLILPHPQMHRRTFVLQPLAEIAPWLQHPVLKQTIGALYESNT